MKRSATILLTVLMGCLLAGPSLGYELVYSTDDVLASVGVKSAPVETNPALDADLIDSWDAASEYNWSLNADFAWGNVFDTYDIDEPYVVTELQYYAAPTNGVGYDFYITTDAGGWPDDDNLTLLFSSSALSGNWEWISIDVADAGYVVEPGQIYWFVRTCPIGGWPGFTWASATNYAPPVNPPVKITMSFPVGGWGDWVADWWMLFKVFGDPEGAGGLEVFAEGYPATVGLGEVLDFTAGVRNTGGETEVFDEAMMLVSGPASVTKTLYSGPDVNVTPGLELTAPVSQYVPPTAPLGLYDITLEVLDDGLLIADTSFEVEVVQ